MPVLLSLSVSMVRGERQQGLKMREKVASGEFLTLLWIVKNVPKAPIIYKSNFHFF